MSDEIKSTGEEAFVKYFILHPVAEFAYRSYENKKVSQNVQFLQFSLIVTQVQVSCLPDEQLKVKR